MRSEEFIRNRDGPTTNCTAIMWYWLSCMWRTANDRPAEGPVLVRVYLFLSDGRYEDVHWTI